MEKFRLGTIELPGELIARIHDILKGTIENRLLKMFYNYCVRLSGQVAAEGL